MLDTVIVGGGLCGLALANSLHSQGREFALYEARPRLGGRILTKTSETTGQAVDLGPCWFWPETQPRIARLVADLGLSSLPQWDSGTVLRQTDPNAKPKAMDLDSVHGGAMRVEGGMGGIVAALAARLPTAQIHLEHELISLKNLGECVEAQFRDSQRRLHTVRARRAVLALPPRLLDQRVSFEPALDPRVHRAMRETPTWMADQAKLAMAYPSAFWRKEGLSGNAFAQYPQAVLAEIYDASPADSGVLGGFLALSPNQRGPFREGLPMLAGSQLAQLFGPDAGQGECHYQDWAEEPYTHSTLDTIPPAEHPSYGNRTLRLSHWGDKLYFGGTETAAYGGGYLEGALEAAGRIFRDIVLDLELAA